MKPRVAFTIADNNNLADAVKLKNSIRKFYNEKELPFIIIGQDELDKWNDPNKFYRATPHFARKLMGQYQLVIKIDSDSIVLGNLDYIFNMQYDVATVGNWNRVDPPVYGEVGLATIHPLEYYNNGFVAIRNRVFVEEWYSLCYSRHFDRMPYREQGLLNIMAHYGRFKTLCLDDKNPYMNHSAFYGLRSKGEWNRVHLKGDEFILPKGDNGYPEEDKVLKVIHFAGGADKNTNYRLFFNEECIKRLDYLTNEKGNKG